MIWGADNSGRINVPPDLTNAVAVAAGLDHCLVLKKDGTVINLWAGTSWIIGVSNVIGIAAGQGYGFGALGDDLALKDDGSVVGWNRRAAKDVSSLARELTNITAIASSGAANLALTRDGRLFKWSASNNSHALDITTTTNPIGEYVSINGQNLKDVTAIAVGGDCSLALKKDGTVVAWGSIGLQPATVPDGLSNIVAIAAGSDYCLAITTNRAVAEKFMQKSK